MRRRGDTAPQGEALATWTLLGLVLAAILVTYARLEPAELYHVSDNGIRGGLSRTLVELNFPISLIAIALVLVALGAVPGRAWWVAGPAIALCAVTAWPGVVDQDDLDARWVNVLPALGVALALALTAAATRRAGAGHAPSLRLDPVRIAAAMIAAVLSIPWVAAILGFYLPEGVFIMERPGLEADGSTIAAVHLGQHHGFMGTLILLSALLLSRPRLRGRRIATITRGYVSLAFAYGGVNMVQDYWNEQLVKRDWLDWKIPSALEPAPDPIWLVVLGVAALTAFTLHLEARGNGPGVDSTP